MAGWALVLFCLVILIQFNGFLSENHQEIDIKATEVRRFKRNHESDRVLKSVKNNKQNKTIAKTDNIDASVKSPTKSYVIEKPRVIKKEQKETNKPIISKHFHGTSNKENPVSADKKLHGILKVPKNNDQKESTRDNSPKKTSDKLKININGKNDTESDFQLKNNTEVTTKENKTNDVKSGKREKIPITKTDCSEITKENNIMEIEEHKYEELIRDNPKKYFSQLDARRWEYFNTELHDGLFVQENNYDEIGDIFEKYDPEFALCNNQVSAIWYFTDLNTENHNKANLDSNVIRKTWLDRQIKIKVPKKENAVTKSQRCYQNNNVLKNVNNSENHSLSIISSDNPYHYQYIKYT